MAASSGCIEAERRKADPRAKAVRLTTVGGKGLRPGVDLDDMSLF
jgi:hypothetical protein